MAAYGSLVSVMQIIDQLRHHPRPPISIHKQQTESLTANLTFLQEFLEGYNPNVSYTAEADPLESRIAEAAYAVEDVIESYIVDQIHAQYNNGGKGISSVEFYEGLEKVIEEMDLIKVEATKKMKEKKNMGVQINKKQSTLDGASAISSSDAQKVGMVGLDDVLNQMLDKLTGGERVRQIIPIVGMGGLGKTTLARNIYAHPRIKEHFHICAWSTISQVHDAKKILSEILDQVGLDSGVDLSEGDLGVKLYQHLMGRRYLIVMDDMWSIEAWDVVRRYFPDNENGSRVVVTTRLSKLASQFDNSNGLDMKFLDKTSSWNLFCKIVFGDGSFPLELVDIGKRILKGCRGLPLSIVVIGGLLSKSEPTRENWELIKENLSSVVNLEDEGSCLQILYTSYNNLPAYIKPCFLYMGLYGEDEEIEVFLLVTLWVAEGFIKPFNGKFLEETAEDYIQELVDRNMILVGKRDDCGKVKSLKMHDLLRDLVLREGEKDKFLYVLKDHCSDDREISCGTIITTQRRIVCMFKGEYPPNPTSSSLVRTFIGKLPEKFSISDSRLLRIFAHSGEEESRDEENFIRLVNLRHIYEDVEKHPLPRIPSWPSCLWNLQTLYLQRAGKDCVLDIWKMPLIRHVFAGRYYPLSLADPPLSGDDVVLQNLHTLKEVINLILSENVVKRIPNLRKLELGYLPRKEVEDDDDDEEEEELGAYCLNNLHRLNKLQDLRLLCYERKSLPVQDFILPYSLKKLTLQHTMLPWEDMSSKIGCLPLLQFLQVGWDAFIGSEWETVEGQFSSLKFLKILCCYDLVHWTTESNHFPRLERLVLDSLPYLNEVPSSIGDIPTLKSISLESCSDSAVESARRIQEEQEECGNQLLLQIDIHEDQYDFSSI